MNENDLYEDDGVLDQQVEEMIAEAERGFGNDVPTGQRMLDGLVVLSAVVSALFFLIYGRQVFSDLWIILAVVMTLLCGLMPTEYAYVAWRNIRKQKRNLTTSQQTFSGLGIGFAVGFAVFSTIAMFIAGFPQTPESIRQYSGWFVFIALTFPLPIQFILVAGFELKDRTVVENHTKARAHAITFDALQRFNLARLGATLTGMRRQLARELKGYGTVTGERGAAKLLGRAGAAPPPATRPTAAADPPDDDDELLLEDHQRPSFFRWFGRGSKKPKATQPTAPTADMSNSTHDAPRQDEPATAPTTAAGQGAAPRLHPDDVAAIATLLAQMTAPTPAPSPNGQEVKPSHPH